MFDVEVDLELTGDRRPRNQGFPVLWSRGLAKERSRRKLEMWRNFGCEGFEFHGEKLAESAGDSELAHSPSKATREGEEEERERVNGSEAGGELGKAPGMTWRRSTAGKSGSLSTTARTAASGGVGAITPTCSTGGSMGEGRERLTCGGHV